MSRFDITDMDEFLSTDCAADAIRHSLESFEDVDARQWVEASLAQTNGDASRVGWSEQRDHAKAFAGYMEKLVATSTGSRLAEGLMNSATMIRVLAGREALVGKPFEWKPYEKFTGYSAQSPEGTRWDITPRGRSADDWGITIAHWDYPDYFTRDLDRAMRIAEQISARPAFPSATWIEDWS
jgi:hypothetical protein